MVSSVSSRASNDLGGTASIISLSPSLRMMASSPGSSNSRRILTAWFLPFLNSFTCRSGINLIYPVKIAYAEAYAGVAR